DGVGGTVTQTITVTVTNVNETPTLAAVSDASGTYGTAITTISLSGSDVDAGDTLTYTAQTTLPAGLSINSSTAAITGTPTAAGTTSVTVRVTDAGSLFAERTFNITIAQRALTIAADAKTKTYGDVDPALTSQITSGTLYSSDALSGSLSRTAGASV